MAGKRHWHTVSTRNYNSHIRGVQHAEIVWPIAKRNTLDNRIRPFLAKSIAQRHHRIGLVVRPHEMHEPASTRASQPARFRFGDEVGQPVFCVPPLYRLGCMPPIRERRPGRGEPGRPCDTHIAKFLEGHAIIIASVTNLVEVPLQNRPVQGIVFDSDGVREITGWYVNDGAVFGDDGFVQIQRSPMVLQFRHRLATDENYRYAPSREFSENACRRFPVVRIVIE